MLEIYRRKEMPCKQNIRRKVYYANYSCVSMAKRKKEKETERIFRFVYAQRSYNP